MQENSAFYKSKKCWPLKAPSSRKTGISADEMHHKHLQDLVLEQEHVEIWRTNAVYPQSRGELLGAAVLGKGRNIPREPPEWGRHRQLCELRTQACGGARDRGTSKGRAGAPRGPAQSPSPLEDVGGASGPSKAPRNTRDPLRDRTWVGLREPSEPRSLIALVPTGPGGHPAAFPSSPPR